MGRRESRTAPPRVRHNSDGVVCVWKGRTSPCLTHSLFGQHVIDGVVILLGQDGQLTGLLILQPLQHGLVVRLWGVLQQVVPQSLVLAGLDLTGFLELPFDL